jgi:hypothetical protein
MIQEAVVGYQLRSTSGSDYTAKNKQQRFLQEAYIHMMVPFVIITIGSFQKPFVGRLIAS